MKVITNLEAFKADASRPLILGLGNFDGLHLGHQALVRHVVQQALEEKGTPALFTFQIHPQQVLRPKKKPRLLFSHDYKLLRFRDLGIKTCFWLPFTEAFSKVTAHEFVTEILLKQLKIKEACMGYNARFGHGREGDGELMRKLAGEHGFKFEQIQPVHASGDFVSSSRLRKLVKLGQMEEAETCLGGPFTLYAEVEPGAGRGKGLGFPTANLGIHSDITPPLGVYPVFVREVVWQNKPDPNAGESEIGAEPRGPWMRGVLNCGHRPTFEGENSDSKPVLEAHLLDFEGDLYGKCLEVAVFRRLREERTYDNPEALKEQISVDIREAEERLHWVEKKGFTK